MYKQEGMLVVSPLACFSLIYDQCLIEFHQLCHAFTLSHVPNGEAIGQHHSPVIVLVGLA